MNELRKKYGFTLVELLIVVAILGILAAVAMPLIEDHTQKAKEATAKENLFILRNAIERYAAQHGGVSPGYAGNNPEAPVVEVAFYLNMLVDNYLSNKPQNPFNYLTSVKMISNNTPMPATATGSFGWVYQPQTKNIRLDWPGTDSKGVAYYEY